MKGETSHCRKNGGPRASFLCKERRHGALTVQERSEEKDADSTGETAASGHQLQSREGHSGMTQTSVPESSIPECSKQH